MHKEAQTYIAATGMITAVGGNSALTAASINAGINCYEASEFDDHNGQPVTMAAIPDQIYSDMQIDYQGTYYCGLYERVIKMAIVAIREVTSTLASKTPLPMVLAMPEALPDIKHITLDALSRNLLNNHELPILQGQIRSIHTGRAAGIEGVDLASRILCDLKQDYVLLGSSDSYWHLPIIKNLDKAHRLLAPGSADGFAPAEGAGFILLTQNPKKALEKNGYIVSLNQPGTGKEAGHILSDGSQPYRGDGLTTAFKQALKSHHGEKIDTIYSSMNGENYWAKEYGVAFTRNQHYFTENVNIVHPAEAYGDLGAATGTVLIALSAINLLNTKKSTANLVYSASDSSHRAAIVLQKIPLASALSLP